MQNEDVIADLKQFITATISQSLTNVATKDDLDKLSENLENKMDKRFDELDSKVATIADAHAEQLEDHEQRLAGLEHRVA